MRIAADRWLIALLLPVAAIALYVIVGEPASLTAAASRPSAASLDRHVRAQPRDERAWILLGRELARQERFTDSAQAYAQAVALPKAARDAGVLAEYADVLGMAHGGTLQGEPTEIIERALRLDPRQRQALELAGSAAYERGDHAAASRHWRALLAQVPAGSPEAQELTAAIARSDRYARVRLP